MTLPRQTGAEKTGESCGICGEELVSLGLFNLSAGSATCPKCNGENPESQKASEGTVPRTLGT